VATAETLSSAAPLIGRIPVRNIWLLFLYASDLAKFHGQFEAAIENSPEFSDLMARLLCYAVEKRLRRNLSRGYRRREDVLTRIRGRIDILKTHTEDLLRQGSIACRFEEHTIDAPRNRLVRVALDALAGGVSDAVLGHQCRRLAGDLGRQGVGGIKPSRAEVASDQIGRHDAEDVVMVTLARLAFDLVLPTEEEGGHAMTHVEKDEVLVRQLFEKAVGNFYAAELSSADGWQVIQGKRLSWQVERSTEGIAGILPGMITDIILENRTRSRRIVIDTKFTGMFGSSAYRERTLKSGYVYQIYAYLRSQEHASDPLSAGSEGLMLHPTIDCDIDETVRIQGHDIRFVTVDLAQPESEILARLRSLPALASGD
jgi:5-methylcytosine-specific restriction enzyme subunit McrC